MKKQHLLYLCSIAFCIWSCQEPSIDVVPAGAEVGVERAENVEIFYSDSARLKVKIAGPVMLLHTDNSKLQEEFPSGVLVEFYDLTGEVTSRLTAKYGTRFQRLGKVIVRDSVVWQSNKNEKIETEELNWNERTKKVFTKKFARISRADEIIYGYGFEADQDFSNARIRAVTGRVKVENIEND